VDWHLLAVAIGVAVALYLAAVAALVACGGRRNAAAIARFVPDCAILFGRLARDPRVPRRHKLMLLGAAGYLAMPIDLVPDFIPVAGQVDDAIIVALALRMVIRGAGDELCAEHWPGTPGSLALVERLAGRP
jgi:uncharacterized membrane protein YkvA (DUF1232 family)